MSTHSFHSPFNPRDLVPERVARRVAAHPRTVAVNDAATSPAQTPETDREGPSTTGNPEKILRRWSVAQLVAAATWPRVVASARLPPPGAGC